MPWFNYNEYTNIIMQISVVEYRIQPNDTLKSNMFMWREFKVKERYDAMQSNAMSITVTLAGVVIPEVSFFIKHFCS